MHPGFKTYRLTNAGREKAEAIAAAFDELLLKLVPMCPEGREFAMVKTHLEIACGFAKKSVALRLENQEA